VGRNSRRPQPFGGREDNLLPGRRKGCPMTRSPPSPSRERGSVGPAPRRAWERSLTTRAESGVLPSGRSSPDSSWEETTSGSARRKVPTNFKGTPLRPIPELRGIETSYSSFYQDKAGRSWVGTANGSLSSNRAKYAPTPSKTAFQGWRFTSFRRIALEISGSATSLAWPGGGRASGTAGDSPEFTSGYMTCFTNMDKSQGSVP